ncbi:unnamed protein product [Linum trigynum]|uniref:Uncharacterized protein n=1 Tax=Linum trigynum TaxID=586398 RepID=A0AAV2E9C3_9ROSI
MNILNKLGFGVRSPDPSAMDPTIPQSHDDDSPAPGQQFAQFGVECFLGSRIGVSECFRHYKDGGQVYSGSPPQSYLRGHLHRYYKQL